VRSVGAERAVRAYIVQPSKPTCNRVRPVARARRNGLQRGRPRRANAHRPVRTVTKSGPAHTGPPVTSHLGASVPGGRPASVGV